jgi:hypothetical protein
MPKIFFYSLRSHELFQEFSTWDIKISNIIFFLFLRLTRVNQCGLKLNLLIESTPRLGLITMDIWCLRDSSPYG